MNCRITNATDDVPEQSSDRNNRSKTMEIIVEWDQFNLENYNGELEHDKKSIKRVVKDIAASLHLNECYHAYAILHIDEPRTETDVDEEKYRIIKVYTDLKYGDGSKNTRQAFLSATIISLLHRRQKLMLYH